jgi:hypothetical protein
LVAGGIANVKAGAERLGQALSMSSGSGSSGPQGSAAAAGGATLRPYGGPGGGHHVPAKKAFEGAPGYNPNTALAIPNAELARLGVRHPDITRAQNQGYRAFAKTGKSLTWDAMSAIETNALIKGGLTPDMASATVKQAIDALKSAGVQGPTRIHGANKMPTREIEEFAKILMREVRDAAIRDCDILRRPNSQSVSAKRLQEWELANAMQW